MLKQRLEKEMERGRHAVVSQERPDPDSLEAPLAVLLVGTCVVQASNDRCLIG